MSIKNTLLQEHKIKYMMLKITKSLYINISLQQLRSQNNINVAVLKF